MAMRLVPAPLPDPNPADSFGERIESARGYRRMRQQDVVDAMHTAAVRRGMKAPGLRTLSDWVADKTSPTVRQLVLLAEALDTTPDWFVRDCIDLTDPDGGGGSVMPESSSACTRGNTVVSLFDRYADLGDISKVA